MWSRFSEEARRAISHAQEEAVRLDANGVGPEHILFGIACDPDCGASAVLARLGITPEGLRTALSPLLTQGPGRTGPDIGLSRSTERSIDLSFNTARYVGDRHMGTEHLLLGIARLPDHPANIVLVNLGASAVRLSVEAGEFFGKREDWQALSKVVAADAAGGQPAIDRIVLAMFLCASLGAIYLGIACAAISTVHHLSSGHPLYGGPGWLPIQVLLTMSLLSAACSGAVTGAIYAVTGGRLGVAMAGFFGVLANPALEAMRQTLSTFPASSLPPATLAKLLAMGVGIPLFLCLGFAWLLYRAGETESALPLLSPVAGIQKDTGVHALPALTRLVIGGALGFLVAPIIARLGADYVMRLMP